MTTKAITRAEPTPKVQQIRSQIQHPIIDSDGHSLEFLPAVRDHLRTIAGDAPIAGFDMLLDAARIAQGLTHDQRRALGMFRLTWWGFPAQNTIDRATAMLPRLQYERLDEFGIDYAILYPTFGLASLLIDEAEQRQAVVRAFNHYYAEEYAAYQDRLSHVALIPMHTPEEAIAELDHAVGELGFKAALFAGFVYRPLEGENLPRAARWVDTLGWESPYDYDPVWARCEELGIAPTFHSSAMGWHRGNSQTNYVFNHIGNFAAAGETTCRSLFFDGVPRRFPKLAFAFLEGGVGWGCNLYADVIGHFEKRSRGAIEQYDPRRLDRALLSQAFERYAGERALRHIAELEDDLHVLANPDEERANIDEFERSGIENEAQIRDVFTEQFYFGCEAEDPINATAFDTKMNPLGARLRPIIGSDIGHWDVCDAREVVSEAWELVEKQLISEDDFRAFTFDNPWRFWTRARPSFFEGTRVAGAAPASPQTA